MRQIQGADVREVSLPLSSWLQLLMRAATAVGKSESSSVNAHDMPSRRCAIPTSIASAVICKVAANRILPLPTASANVPTGRVHRNLVQVRFLAVTSEHEELRHPAHRPHEVRSDALVGRGC